MRVGRWSAILACASLFVAAAPATAQSVKSGIEAWQRGDYVGAVAIWRPLAEAGDPDASFNLGQAYRMGRGVLVVLGSAQTWRMSLASLGLWSPGSNARRKRVMWMPRRRLGCFFFRTAIRRRGFAG